MNIQYQDSCFLTPAKRKIEKNISLLRIWGENKAKDSQINFSNIQGEQKTYKQNKMLLT